MREYERKYPLSRVLIKDESDVHYYPNLRKDENGNVISENITFFTLRKTEDLMQILMKMETEVKKYSQNLEIAYEDISGNRWIFIFLNNKQSRNELRAMQKAYENIYDPTFMRWKVD